MPSHLIFGPRKYAAYNLMLARWLALGGDATRQYRYVTMGGTELFDVVNLCWIKKGLIGTTVSYELDGVRFQRAQEATTRLQERGIDVSVVHGDIFSYRRYNDQHHVFFIRVVVQQG
jgi:hypothetical protein